MRNRLYHACCWILCLLSSAAAQPAAAPEEGRYSSLLWEIKGKGVKGVSYLYGTIHAIPADSFFVLPGLQAAAARADRLVLEVPMDLSLQSVIASAQGMMMPGNTRLRDLYPPDVYEEVDAFLSRGGSPLPGAASERMKPILLAEQASRGSCLGADQQSYEIYLNELFRKQEKPVSGLETVGQQLAFLDAIPLDRQAAYLLESIREGDAGCAEYGQLVSRYRRQDLDALSELSESAPGFSDYTEILLYSRNRAWIPKLRDWMQRERLLIAVGAGHLPGPSGVIELLREAGYEVSAVR
ncbi:MAG: TraB/GumN family protein [Bacteroidia bacterium]|nr:TraB/GumN family protein [Bacteroidia bacterium]